MRRLKIIFFLLGAILMTAPAHGEESMQSISVIGQGKAGAPPDMAVIQTGVVTHGDTAIKALSDNNEAMEKILGILKTHKIASKDIQTSSFNVSPEYERDERGRRQPAIIGYRVINQVRVHVRNLEDLGKVLDALIQAGSNQVSGVSFAIDDPTEVMNQARKRAIADARSRAEVYAGAAGVGVGKVLVISEQPIEAPRPPLMERVLAAGAASSVPVETGEQEYHVQIHVVFSLLDRREVPESKAPEKQNN